MENFADYSHAIASMAFWSILVLVLSGMSTRGRTADQRCACGKPKRDYDSPVYRRERAFMNAVETSGPFIAAALAAILVGGPAFWVNLFASVFIVARVAMAVVHIKTTNQPLRSACFAIGMFCIIALAIMALVGAIFSGAA